MRVDTTLLFGRETFFVRGHQGKRMFCPFSMSDRYEPSKQFNFDSYMYFLYLMFTITLNQIENITIDSIQSSILYMYTYIHTCMCVCVYLCLLHWQHYPICIFIIFSINFFGH